MGELELGASDQEGGAPLMNGRRAYTQGANPFTPKRQNAKGGVFAMRRKTSRWKTSLENAQWHFSV
jgi:hypothetical protein